MSSHVNSAGFVAMDFNQLLMSALRPSAPLRSSPETASRGTNSLLLQEPSRREVPKREIEELWHRAQDVTT